jgi:hypothetical protein
MLVVGRWHRGDVARDLRWIANCRAVGRFEVLPVVAYPTCAGVVSASHCTAGAGRITIQTIPNRWQATSAR